MENNIVATTITLSGRLADVTDRSIETITRVTAKAPAYRPGPGVDITTTQPAQVNLTGDGKITLNVVAGLGWLYLEGDGWSDSIRFVAAAGMTTLWEAVVNALPNANQLQELLGQMQSAGLAIEEAKRKALLALRDAAVKADLTWTRGTVPDGDSPESWVSGMNRQGIWDIPNWSHLDSLAARGYISPVGRNPHYLMHMDDVAGIGGSVQVAYPAGGSRSVFIRSRGKNDPWGPWAAQAQFGVGASLDCRGMVGSTGKSPDAFTTAESGVWMVENYSDLRAVVAHGYRPPLDAAPHMLRHEESPVADSNQAVQTVTYLSRPTSEQFVRTRQSRKTEWSPWQRRDTLDLSSTDRTGFLTLGDSWVEGGANNQLWTDQAAWPYKLSEELGVAVKNAGKGGAVVDETILTVGARRTYLKIEGGEIPAAAGGVAPVELSWEPDIRSPRWFSVPGTLAGAKVYLEQNGKTGAWTIRRMNDKPLDNAAVTVGDDWVEWVSELAIEFAARPTIVHIGINNTGGTRGQHQTDVDHIVAGISQLIDSRPTRAHDIIVMGITPHYGKTGSRNKVLDINARVKAAYPRQFFDNFEFLKDLGPGGAMQMAGLLITDEDRQDVANGFAPRSLYPAGDVVHVDKPAHAAIAKKLATFVRSRGMVIQ